MPLPRVRAYLSSRFPPPFRLRASSPPPYYYYHPHYKHPFSTSARRSATAQEPNYYEILDVPITASPSEIKQKFYSLSLRHHPDRNRNDPTASERFARISSAYNVLSNHTKRATYDRDHGILAHHMSSTHSTAQPGQNPMGSHSSYSANLHHKGASYAGSRPASGLSKRRGPFRGPPPSFYAHGGYGNRKPPPGGTSSSSSSFAGGRAAPGSEDPTSFIDRNTVNHFNARGHFRTQTAEDARREQRRSREASATLNDQYIGTRGGFALRFIIVFGMLIGTVSVAGLSRGPEELSTKSSTTRPSPRKEES
ncbi:hypothetical protein FE257_009549 [Aspergillus nanangensis]|uniref:J domain-containing protein n=1 Tax=Aspergillus nanangensis TaxID=2582783 RepID=A0AAD4CJW0_ASPNN|nr:hypothetical protein FE257_009549 [Aspergillus nanangensis]